MTKKMNYRGAIVSRLFCLCGLMLLFAVITDGHAVA
jgi:general stress protein CsbA